MTMDQLKSYHSKRTDSICPGHPGIEHQGIEVTTGPLGQGGANAVGMSMASKHLAVTYNKIEYPFIDNTTWCMVGDACLQEGVALEAVSRAGHWKLNNLVIMYDNNQITCDGSVDLTNNEDINLKMRACGWDVIDIEDGCYDIESIVKALETAKGSKEKPTFINIRTVIGVGSTVAGDAKAHGTAFGSADVASIKRTFGMHKAESYHIPQQVYYFFADSKSRGEALEARWNALFNAYQKEFPELGAESVQRVAGSLPLNWIKRIPAKRDLPTYPTLKEIRQVDLQPTCTTYKQLYGRCCGFVAIGEYDLGGQG
jgi:dihydroxyacetone synthase